MYGAWIILCVFLFIFVVSLAGFFILACSSKNREGLMSLFITIAVLSFIIAVASGVIGAIASQNAEAEYLAFENTREYIQEIYNNGTATDNIAFSSAVIDANQWLTQAKASIEAWGCFSKYFGLGIEDVLPIMVQ